MLDYPWPLEYSIRFLDAFMVALLLFGHIKAMKRNHTRRGRVILVDGKPREWLS